jgi:hypothetical protein
MRNLVLAAAAVMLAARPAAAGEGSESSPFRVAPFVGAYVPRGQMRSEVEGSVLVGFTASADLAPYLAAVGAFGWVPTKVKRAANGELDILQYDLGIQAQHAFAVGGPGISLQPFVGTGFGLRTYVPHHLGSGAETYFGTWYAGGGASIRYRAAELGVAARYYVSTYEGPVLSLRSGPRHDLALATSVGVRF